MFLTAIGKVLAGLDSAALWKLSFVKSPLLAPAAKLKIPKQDSAGDASSLASGSKSSSTKHGLFVKVLHTNRNVTVEAEERAPNVTMEDMLDPQHNIFEIGQFRAQPLTSQTQSSLGALQSTNPTNLKSNPVEPVSGATTATTAATSGDGKRSSQNKTLKDKSSNKQPIIDQPLDHATDRDSKRDVNKAPETTPQAPHKGVSFSAQQQSRLRRHSANLNAPSVTSQMAQETHSAPYPHPHLGSAGAAVTTGTNGNFVVTAPFFWQRPVLSYLTARDALAFSATCVRAYATGVRSVPAQIVVLPNDKRKKGQDSNEVSLETQANKTDPVHFCHLSVMLPDYLHSMVVNYTCTSRVDTSLVGRELMDIGGVLIAEPRDYQPPPPPPLHDEDDPPDDYFHSSSSKAAFYPDENDDPGPLLNITSSLTQQINEYDEFRAEISKQHKTRRSSEAVSSFRGMTEEGKQFKPDDSPLDNISQLCRDNRFQAEVHFESLRRTVLFNDQGRFYLAYYLKASPRAVKLSLSNITQRHLIYACDSYGNTPLHELLTLPLLHRQEAMVAHQVDLLLKAGFGDGSSSSNLFHMYALHAQHQELLQRQNESSSNPKASTGKLNPDTSSSKRRGSTMPAPPSQPAINQPAKMDDNSIGMSTAASGRSLPPTTMSYMYRLPLHYYLKNNDSLNVYADLIHVLVEYCDSWCSKPITSVALPYTLPWFYCSYL